MSAAAHRAGVLDIGGGGMMDGVRQWLLGIACTAMLLALAQAIAPEGGAKKACKLAGGLALLLAAVGPVLKLDDGAVARAAAEYQRSVERRQDALTEQTDLFYQTIIEEETAAYISDKAEALGMNCAAEVTYYYGPDGEVRPEAVVVRGEFTEDQRVKLSRALEGELGIPAQRQSFERVEDK